MTVTTHGSTAVTAYGRDVDHLARTGTRERATDADVVSKQKCVFMTPLMTGVIRRVMTPYDPHFMTDLYDPPLL